MKKMKQSRIFILFILHPFHPSSFILHPSSFLCVLCVSVVRRFHSSRSRNSPAVFVKIHNARIPKIMWPARVYQTHWGWPCL